MIVLGIAIGLVIGIMAGYQAAMYRAAVSCTDCQRAKWPGDLD